MKRLLFDGVLVAKGEPESWEWMPGTYPQQCFWANGSHFAFVMVDDEEERADTVELVKSTHSGLVELI